MPPQEMRTICLPTDDAEYIDALVASGAYASASEVVQAGMRALQDRESVTERWLREDVAVSYDAMQRDPTSALPAAQVFAAIRAHHGDRVKKGIREV